MIISLAKVKNGKGSNRHDKWCYGFGKLSDSSSSGVWPNKSSPQYILNRNKICYDKKNLVHNVYCITIYNQKIEASGRMNV